MENSETTMLEEICEFKLKDRDKTLFGDAELNGNFPHCLISDKYVIKGSKIFYLFKDKSLGDGILDCEDLANIKTEGGLKKFF